MNDLEDFTGENKKDLAAQPPVEVFAGFYMYINSKRDTGIKKGFVPEQGCEPGDKGHIEGQNTQCHH